MVPFFNSTLLKKIFIDKCKTSVFCPNSFIPLMETDHADFLGFLYTAKQTSRFSKSERNITKKNITKTTVAVCR